MLLEHCKWHPGLTADLNLTEDDIKKISGELIHFHELFHDCFGRIEHRRLGLAYMSGLMSNAGAKSVEPIALEFLGPDEIVELPETKDDPGVEVDITSGSMLRIQKWMHCMPDHL